MMLSCWYYGVSYHMCVKIGSRLSSDVVRASDSVPNHGGLPLEDKYVYPCLTPQNNYLQ